MLPIQNMIKRINNFNPETLNAIVFGIVYFVWKYAGYVTDIEQYISQGTSTLDGSWILGLNWASLINLKWSGENLVFTYGPLYFLSGYLMPGFHSGSTIFLTVLGLNLFYAVCSAYIYSFFAKLSFEDDSRWVPIVVAVILLLQPLNISLVPLFVAFIFLPVIFPEGKSGLDADRVEQYARYGVIALLLAVIPFIKFSHIFESFLFVAVFIVFLIYSRKYLDAALIGILFIIFTALIWIFTSQESISFFPHYLVSRLAMSGGYTEAMLLDFTRPEFRQMFVLALLFFAILTPMLFYFFFTKQYKWGAAWLLPMITLFLGFKSAFVRADGHAYFFLEYIPVSALYFLYLIEYVNDEEQGAPYFHWRRPILPILSIIVLGAFSLQSAKLLVGNQFMDIIKMFDSNAYGYSEDRASLQKTYNIEHEFMLGIDSAETIDIIPWDIALLYAYDLNWKPRPVLQSYASYTPRLDDLDATFFQQPDSPGQVIFSLFAIDARYPLFDTPHTFRVLLDNYEFVRHTQDGRFALLTKRSDELSRDFELINQETYHLYDRIAIPEVQDGHVFMVVEIAHTARGSLLNLLYRPTPLSVEIKVKYGEKFRHRFVRGTGENGLFVSNYVQSLDDLQAIFNETYQQNISWVRFLGNSWQYEKELRVTFYKLPFRK